MKLTIEVTDPTQAEAIKRALAEPETCALIAVMGEILIALPDYPAKLILDDLASVLDDLKDAANVRGEKL